MPPSLRMDAQFLESAAWRRLSPVARVVLLALVQQAGPKRQIAITQRNLAESAGLDKKSIPAALDALQGCKLISRQNELIRICTGDYLSIGPDPFSDQLGPFSDQSKVGPDPFSDQREFSGKRNQEVKPGPKTDQQTYQVNDMAEASLEEIVARPFRSVGDIVDEMRDEILALEGNLHPVNELQASDYQELADWLINEWALPYDGKLFPLWRGKPPGTPYDETLRQATLRFVRAFCPPVQELATSRQLLHDLSHFPLLRLLHAAKSIPTFAGANAQGRLVSLEWIVRGTEGSPRRIADQILTGAFGSPPTPTMPIAGETNEAAQGPTRTVTL